MLCRDDSTVPIVLLPGLLDGRRPVVLTSVLALDTPPRPVGYSFVPAQVTQTFVWKDLLRIAPNTG